MFFYAPCHIKSCSKPFRPTAQLLVAGKVHQALERFTAIGRDPDRWRTPYDALLAMAVADSSGRHRTRDAIARLAFKKWPDQPAIVMQWIWSQANRGRLQAAIDLAEQQLLSLNTPLSNALIAWLYECSGNSVVADRHRTRSKTILDHFRFQAADDEAGAHLFLCLQAMLKRDWETALKQARCCRKKAPDWPMGYRMVAECQFAAGEADGWKDLFAQYVHRGIESENIDYFRILQAFSAADWTKAADRVIGYLQRWPNASFHTALERLLPFLFWNSGAFAEARRAAETVPASQRESRDPILSAAEPTTQPPSVCIPLPLRSQQSLLCVPTAVSLVAAAQGIEFDPNMLYSAMGGYDGTPLWSMADFLNHNGFRVHILRAEPDILRSMIDQGIPVIAPIDSLFSCHVEVICGYSDSLDVYYIRDPMDWIPLIVTHEQLTERYAASGSYLFAIVADYLSASVRIDDADTSPGGRAFLDLGRAVVQADLDQAERADGVLSQDPSMAFLRLSAGYGATLTPQAYTRLNRSLFDERSTPTLNRVRAFVELQPNDFLHHYEPFMTQVCEHLSAFERRYLETIRHHYAGNVETALDQCERLLAQSPRMESLWIKKSELLLELGLLADARQSADKALLLAPRSISIQRRVSHFFPDRRPHAQRLASLERLIEAAPNVPEVKNALSTELFYGADGEQYEHALKTCIKLFPRNPKCYEDLASWYLNQDREELAGDILAQGRSLIDEDEMPKWPFEDETARDAYRSSGEFDPDDKQALLTLLKGCDDLMSFQAERAMECLSRMAETSSLLWHEETEWRSYGLLRHFLSCERDGKQVETAHWLPDELPGTLPYSFNYFMERLQIYLFSSKQAGAILPWAELFAERCPDSAEVHFNLGIIKERTGLSIDAEHTYRAIVHRSPGFSGALYRLGLLLEERGDKVGATAAFETAVEAEPNQPGAIDRLIILNAELGDTNAMLLWHSRKCQLQPYSFFNADELLNAVAQADGFDAALHKLQANRSFLSSDGFAALEARLYAGKGDINQAGAVLKAQSTARFRYPRHVLITQLDCTLAAGNARESMRLVDEGLRCWPDDPWFLHMNGDLLEKSNPTEAALFYQALIIGRSLHMFVEPLLRLSEKKLSCRAIELVNSAPYDAQSALLCPVFNALYAIDHSEYVEFLFYCEETFRDDSNVLQQLVCYHVMAGNIDQAIRHAESSFRNSDRSPDCYPLLAYAYEEKELGKAIEYLQKHVDITGSVDSLVDLARCYQNSYEYTQARRAYYGALEKDPHNELAMNNLIMLHERPRKFYSNFCDSIASGKGGSIQYFLVNAVKVARAAGKPLPAPWLNLTLRRLEQLDHEQPFRDERPRLLMALATWYASAKDRRCAQQYYEQLSVGEKIRYFLARWPGKRWLPRR